MTYKEVKNRFMLCNIRLSKQDYSETYSEEERQLLYMATKAIDKQIAMPTADIKIIEGQHGKPVTMWQCGRCGNIIYGKKDKRYCPNCGQKIAWRTE